MKEMDNPPSSRTKIKIALLLATLIIVYMAMMLPAPTITFNAPLFESAFVSLILLLFWVGAYLFVRPKHHVHVYEDRPDLEQAHTPKSTTQ